MNVKEAIDKSIFFLGAGASHDASCKMSLQMLQELRSLVCSPSDYFTEAECELVKFLLSCLHYHSEWRTLDVNRRYNIQANIEEFALLIRRIKNRENFLPYPITGNWADKLTTLESKFREEFKGNTDVNIYEKLEDTIKGKLLFEWLEVQDTSFLNGLDDFLKENPEDFKLEVFSLNNDLVLENHYDSAPPYRGFYSGSWRGFDDVPNLEEFNRIHLYKLHGSLDWVRLNDGTIWEKGKISDIVQEDGASIEHYPFIIFGQGSKFFSVEPFFNLIQNFSKKLKERNYFFIIGYSFFDPYINNLLIHAVREGVEDNKKIIIINPYFAQPPLEQKHFDVSQDLFVSLLKDDAESKRLLIEYLVEIQKNAFFSELPEFNIKQIPSESIMYIKIGMKEFIDNFFLNGGKNFLRLINQFEDERKENLPFK